MEARIPARLTASEGRSFAFTVGGAFLVLAGIVWWRGHAPVATVLGALGGTLALAGVLVAGRLGPVYAAWMRLAHMISKVTTPIFMGITYYLVLSPTGALMRLFGRNPLRPEVEGDSFWVPRPEGTERRSDLERQF